MTHLSSPRLRNLLSQQSCRSLVFQSQVLQLLSLSTQLLMLTTHSNHPRLVARKKFLLHPQRELTQSGKMLVVVVTAPPRLTPPT